MNVMTSISETKVDILNRFIGISLRRPKTVLAIWFIVAAASTIGAAQLDGALSAGGFSDPRAEAITTQSTIEHAFGDEPNQALVTLHSKKVLTTADFADVTAVLDEFGAKTITTPDASPDLLSADGRTAVVVAGFPGDNTEVQNLTPGLQEALNRASKSDVYLTGQPALDFQLNIHSKEDATRAELIVFPLLIVILLFVFRSITATLIPLVLAGSALAVSSGIGWVATRFTDISILYSNIVSMIGLAVAVDYSLFIIKRYREELAAGREVRPALEIAFSTSGRAVLFSGIAVVVALTALFIPGLMAFTSIALGGIVVTIVALLLSLTALPAALALLGRRIAWGSFRWTPRKSRTDSSQGSPRRGRTIVVGLLGVAAMLAVSFPILGISLQSPVASATILPSSDTARQGLEIAQKGIGSDNLFPLQVVLTAADSVPVADMLQAVRRISEFTSAQANSSHVTSLTELGIPLPGLEDQLRGGNVPPELATFWAKSDGKLVSRIFVATTEGPDSVSAHQLVSALRSESPGSGITLHVTGATAQGLDFDNTLIRSIPWIVLFVFVLTFAMLVVAFRSPVLPVLALLFNSLVVGASLGVLTLVVGLISHSPVNSVTPVLLFAVMFGLSMDYMVIIISRVIEAFRGGVSFDQAVTIGTRSTRSMVNSAAFIMVAVFASFASAQISIVREIGIGLGVAVLLDALVVRTLVMPAVLRLIGPRVLARRDRKLSKAFRANPLPVLEGSA